MNITTQTLHVAIHAFRFINGSILLSGWVVNPKHSIDAIDVYLNDMLWASNAPLIDSHHLFETRYRQLPHARLGGIGVVLPIGAIPPGQQAYQLMIVGKQNGHPCGTFRTTVRDLVGEVRRIPLPDPTLQLRAGQETSHFLADGWRIYNDLRRWIVPYIQPISLLERVLDWGCGCGRVMRFLLEEVGPGRAFGCDIDPEMIAWNQRYLPGASFTLNDIVPPLPYPSEYFDLVFGISVFTHTDEQSQFLWLRELRRVTKPGGLVAVSVLRPAYVSTEMRQAAERTGFANTALSRIEQVEAVAPHPHDQLTTHTRSYISHYWSRTFDLLDFVEEGINSHQDLVLMRRIR